MKLIHLIRLTRSLCRRALLGLTLCVAHDVSAQTPDYDASFDTQNVPQIVYAGMPFVSELTFVNTGSKTWTGVGAERCCIRYQNPKNQARNGWRDEQIDLPGQKNVNSGSSVKFTFRLYAPKATGDYDFHWRPLKHGAVGWFGDASVKRTVRVVDPPRLDNAPLMVGYQGWFATPNDEYLNSWKHWFKRDAEALIAEVDMWPFLDPIEFPSTAKLADTGFRNGLAGEAGKVCAFSSANPYVVDTHFKWMKQYGIDGAFVGRFAQNIVSTDPNVMKFRDRVLDNALAAAATHNRWVSVEYDLSDGSVEGDHPGWLDAIVEDWSKLTAAGGRAANPRWLRQAREPGGEALPVVRIYGLGFDDDKRRYFSKDNAIRFLTRMREKGAYIVGGVPTYWRTDSASIHDDARSGWREVYEMMDMLSPWTVGRYANNDEVLDHMADRVIPDMVELVRIRNSNNGSGPRIGYLPYAFPGFSWSNLKRDRPAADGGRPPYNQIPRRGGKFFWRQIYEFLNCGNQTLGIAMFDEVDEGTAIFKVCNTRNRSPLTVNGGADYFVNLSEGDVSFSDPDSVGQGTPYPVDWYLKLAEEAAAHLKGTNTKPLTPTIPITP